MSTAQMTQAPAVDYAGLPLAPVEKLRVFMDRHGYDVKALAEAVDLSYNHVAQMARGDKDFSPLFRLRFGRLARDYGVQDERDVLGQE